MMINRIDTCFTILKKTNQKAFIPFITAGDPDLNRTVELVKAMASAGADIIELGVPYSEPVADGPVIQRATQRSLAAGTTLPKILDTVALIRETEQVPLVLMSYYNPILQYGLDKFVQRAVQVGVDGVIVPDLPVEECLPLYQKADEANLHLIPLVAPTTTVDRMENIMRFAKGFIYCVSVTGVTGYQEDISNQIENLTNMVRGMTTLPIGVGFGVSTPTQAAALVGYCDAVIVGSAIVKIIESSISEDVVGSVANLVTDFKSALSGLEV